MAKFVPLTDKEGDLFYVNTKHIVLVTGVNSKVWGKMFEDILGGENDVDNKPQAVLMLLIGDQTCHVPVLEDSYSVAEMIARA